MKYFILSAMVAVMITGGLLSCSTKPAPRGDMSAFVDEFEKKAEYLDQQVSLYEWEYLSRGRSDSLEYYKDLSRALLSNPQQLADIKSQLSRVQEGISLRKLDLIYRRCLRTVIDADPNISPIIDSLVDYRAGISSTYEGSSYSFEQLGQILAAESDRFKRRTIFASQAASGGKLAEGAVSLARMRNHIVSRMGYNSYYDLMLQADGIDKSDLQKLLNDLDRLSSDKYRAALDSLMKSTGIDDLRLWDIGYIFQQTESRVAQYFTADKQRTLLESTLAGLGFKLRARPIYFLPMVATDYKPDDGIVTRHIPDDIRIPTSIEDGPRSLARLFAQAGRALYAVHIDAQDHLLTMPPAPCFEKGMARIITGLTELSDWRRKYAGMPEPLVLALQTQCDFRHLYNLRMALLNTTFERALYSDPFADMKQVYGDLFEKYMMFPLDGDYYPWVAQIDFIAHPVSLQNDLLGDCIAAQTYHYLSDKYGAVLDDQHTREFLVQNYYRFGSKDDWQTLLERGTGEKLQAGYYLDFPCD